jgi:F-type H+-transporting ATPase subunit gamma
MAERLNRHFIDGDLHEVYLIYNRFKSMMSQELVVRRLLPLDIIDLKARIPADKREADPFGFEMEPDGMEFANALLPRYVSTMVFQALLESYASELAARMTAMENATRNAEDMIFDLNLWFNKARQAAITREITEIVGGAEALKG